MTRTKTPENTNVRAGEPPVRSGEAEPIQSCRNEGRDRPVIPRHGKPSLFEDSVLAGVLPPNETPDSQASVCTAHEAASQPRVDSDFLGFHLIEVLGRGAFGTVYLARQGDLADRLVVLKISPRRDEEPRLLAQLQHTNIVPIYSIHSARSLQVVCMPFFGTTTLQDVSDHLKSQVMLPETGLGLISSLIDNRLEQQTRLTPRSENESGPPSGDTNQNDIPRESQWPQPPPSDETLKYLKGLTYVQAVLWVGSRLASGLAHAHERKILHLDLKPANILLTDEGQPMLLDLNLSVDLKQGTSLAAFGGTALYMSPEQLEAFQGKSGTVDGRSDIYSLGIILFELLTRRRPLEVTKGPAGRDRRRSDREPKSTLPPRSLLEQGREPCRRIDDSTLPGTRSGTTLPGRLSASGRHRAASVELPPQACAGTIASRAGGQVATAPSLSHEHDHDRDGGGSLRVPGLLGELARLER